MKSSTYRAVGESERAWIWCNIAQPIMANTIGQPVQPNIPVRYMNTSPTLTHTAIIMTEVGLKSNCGYAELTSFFAISQAESGTFYFAAYANQLAKMYAKVGNSTFPYRLMAASRENSSFTVLQSSSQRPAAAFWGSSSDFEVQCDE